MNKELVRNIILISLIVLFSIFILFNEYGLIKYFKLKKDLSELSSKIQKSEMELKNLRSEIDSLNNSNFMLEKIAREKFHMIRPNEKIIEFKLE
ncbi:MAG: hypothetical protein Fur0015_04340 [Ignavibacteriales bacterium]